MRRTLSSFTTVFVAEALLLVLCLLALVGVAYDVKVERLLTSPILSDANSPFDYNFNSAYVPLIGGNSSGVMLDCLAVRVQNLVGVQVPSKIAIFCESSNKLTFSREPYVVLDPSQDPSQADGCEDPRVKLLPDNNTLLMFYSAVNLESDGAARSKLSLASCLVSVDPQCRNWTLHGALFPETFWSKSGALLVRDQAPHFLLWGDTNIWIATTNDFFTYNNTGVTLLEPRSDSFDSQLVESGPPPMQLSDGNYLFLYNSARTSSHPSPKPGWTLGYHLGYAVLNATGDLPTILERSADPIMSPVLGWETCNDQSMVSGQTPNVIFVNGAKALTSLQDTFLIYYQGCDSKMGVALLSVRGSPDDQKMKKK